MRIHNFIFPYIGDNDPHWLMFFQRSGSTTNQTKYGVSYKPIQIIHCL